MNRTQDIKVERSKELQEYRKHKKELIDKAKKLQNIVLKEFEENTKKGKYCKSICLRSSTFGDLYWNDEKTEMKFDCEVMKYLAMMFELEDDYIAEFDEGDFHGNYANVMIILIT